MNIRQKILSFIKQVRLRWAFQQTSKLVGLVIGEDGKGGTGICVEVEDGKMGLLTAKHVVVECLRNTGHIYIAAPYCGIKFQKPELIRIDSTQHGDAAILLFSNSPKRAHRVPLSQWTRDSTIFKNMDALISGVPASNKIINEKEIAWAHFKAIGFFTSTQNDSAWISIRESNLPVPETLAGLSGGGAFNIKGEFIGLITAETNNTSPTKLISVLLPAGYREIYTPHKLPDDAPKGGWACKDETVSLEICKPTDGALVARIEVSATSYRSLTDPDHRYGRFGRLMELTFIIPGISARYPMQIESVFVWDDDTPESQRSAIQEEIKFLLLRLGWLIQGDGEQSIISIRAMR